MTIDMDATTETIDTLQLDGQYDEVREILDYANNRMVISKHGREFQTAVCNIVKASGFDAITGGVAIKLLIYTPDWRRRDEDNLNKALLDAISKTGLWDDDSFICYHVNEKRKDADGIGRIVLQVKPVECAIVKKSGAWLK